MTATRTVWYAAYGSNLDRDRFRYYLRGGRPPGAARTYPGCRDRSGPLEDRPFRMSGRVVFAWESLTWGGGVAFLEPDAPGEVLARAYRLTVQQFVDVLEQEMGRPPGADHDLAEVLVGRRHTLGPGRYETLHPAGELDDIPVLSFSTPDAESLGLNAPAPAYVALMERGLREAHGLTGEQVETYLATCRGYR